MDREQAKKVIEALLYMTDHPLKAEEIQEILESKRILPREIDAIIEEIDRDLTAADSGLRVVRVAGGAQMATRPEMGPFIRRLFKERLSVRLSPSALETLAIIAYKQPIARSDIEQIRGVEASGVMDTLLERRLIKVVGRKDSVGRPRLYGTTIEFLRQVGLNHLTDLPDLGSFVAETESRPLLGDVEPESQMTFERLENSEELPEPDLAPPVLTQGVRPFGEEFESAEDDVEASEPLADEANSDTDSPNVEPQELSESKPEPETQMS